MRTYPEPSRIIRCKATKIYHQHLRLAASFFTVTTATHELLSSIHGLFIERGKFFAVSHTQLWHVWDTVITDRKKVCRSI